MNMSPIAKSSNVAATGHDPESNTLHVRFKNGSTYAYPNVSAEEHRALRTAHSVGSHLHKFIKHKGGERV